MKVATSELLKYFPNHIMIDLLFSAVCSKKLTSILTFFCLKIYQYRPNATLYCSI